MCFFVLHSFTGIIEVEVIFFFSSSFWKRKIAELRVGWIKGSLGGERFLLLREKERKKENQKEKKTSTTRKLWN